MRNLRDDAVGDSIFPRTLSGRFALEPTDFCWPLRIIGFQLLRIHRFDSAGAAFTNVADQSASKNILPHNHNHIAPRKLELPARALACVLGGSRLGDRQHASHLRHKLAQMSRQMTKPRKDWIQSPPCRWLIRGEARRND
jgi:hypothetical protein